MKLAYGKEIPASTGELVDPKHSALLIIDVQNDYAKRNGRVLFPQLVKNLTRVIEAARRTGILILYVQDTLLHERLSDSPAWIRHYMLGEAKKDPAEISADGLDGTIGQQIIDEIRPQQNEIVIKKFRSSAFVGTGLDLILRSNNIRSVIVTGLFTEGCVESTCRDASNEYFVVLAEDCVDSDRRELHDACMKIMKLRYDVLTSEEILTAWSNTTK
ncbi:MAG: cysteine hydrolase family protein [Candidatus Bathyarchaeia archaeon]